MKKTEKLEKALNLYNELFEQCYHENRPEFKSNFLKTIIIRFLYLYYFISWQPNFYLILDAYIYILIVLLYIHR